LGKLNISNLGRFVRFYEMPRAIFLWAICPWSIFLWASVCKVFFKKNKEILNEPQSSPNAAQSSPVKLTIT